MTAEQSADLAKRAATLTQILALLEQLRSEASEGDDSVGWVCEQLNQCGHQETGTWKQN